jgi:hypothetical protein
VPPQHKQHGDGPRIPKGAEELDGMERGPPQIGLIVGQRALH